MMIEFQYFNDCPNAKETLQNLREVLSELEQSYYLKITEVPDIESAQRLNFQGSPTILVNGKDIYTGTEPAGFSYTCRLYEFGGKQTGVIPKKIISVILEEN